MWRPHPKRADVNPDYPRAWGTDDHSGFINNLHKLSWEYQWAENALINLRFLSAEPYLDTPQEQLRAIIIPADPPPLFNARPEPYLIDETNWLVTQDADILETDDGDLMVTNEANVDEVEGTGGVDGGDFSSDFSDDFNI